MGEFVPREELAAEVAKRAQAEKAAAAAENDLRDLYAVNRELKEELEQRRMAEMELKVLLENAAKKMEELKDLRYRIEDKLLEAKEELKLMSAVLYLFSNGGGVPLTAENVKTIVRAMRVGICAEIDEENRVLCFREEGEK